MVQEFARGMIREAYEGRVQDILLFPLKDMYAIYFKGISKRTLWKKGAIDQMTAVIGHFKFLAGMNVGEKRRPQQGSCDYDIGGTTVALRISTVGDFRGRESMVIRILHQDAQMLQYWNLEVAEINRFFRGRGLYLFAGPVGSGKTSLMHEMAKKIFVGCQQMSIEDPVELRQEQMLQLQLNEAIGMTYDRLIKLSLRHRPDLLIIGEIRDKETARAVLRASLTGVTVFSTIHAGSVPGAYQRFIELGVTEEEAAHILKGVCYQRMIQGKGVVDFASEKFTQHGPEYWNQTLDALVEQGVVSEREAREEKIKPSQTA